MFQSMQFLPRWGMDQKTTYSPIYCFETCTYTLNSDRTIRFLRWKAQCLCHFEVEKKSALLITGRRAAETLFTTHIFTRVLTFTFIKTTPLWYRWQLRNTVVAVVEALGCAPWNNPNQFLMIWFATFRRRIFGEAFRN